MFRYSIDSPSYFVPLSSELAHVHAFVEIQNLRYGNRIKFQLEVEERAKQQEILRLTLQPLVENAYFHGLEPKLEGGSVILRIRIEEKSYIHIDVIDDGVGMEEEQLRILISSSEARQFEERLSGLHNVIRRLQLAYGENVTFDIKSNIDVGTHIRLSLPMN